MLRLVLVASLLAGCHTSPPLAADAPPPPVDASLLPDAAVVRACTDSTVAPCMAATTHSDLAWIETNIFESSCTFSGCHSSATDLGKFDLRVGVSYANLVGVSSIADPTRKLVVPNDVHASYLMLSLQDFPPEMATPPGVVPVVGYMPQGAPILCCQKLEAIERWIMAGAPAN